MPYKTKEQRSNYEKLRWINMSKEEKDIRDKRGIERLKRIRKFVADFKIERGCTDCGYREHSCALDFDHIKGNKVKDVSVMRSIKNIMEEISKCEVVCSNCHRIRTYNRYPNTYKS